MIYDVLGAYREYWLGMYSRETTEAYYKRLCRLFDGQSATDPVNRLDVQLVLNRLADIQHKNYFSQSKNAFLRFCEFQNIELSADTLGKIRELEAKTKKKHRKLSPCLKTKYMLKYRNETI